ncbi:MAG: AAA family ATPase [Nanoarchaeota archaeon]|nr:AAA family ATPase [Nanoarchaeota archaeon]
MKIIAIVGMTGSGKSELTKLFADAGYHKIRFGDVTEKVLKERGLEINEQNERSVRESLRKQYGMDAYAKLNLLRIEEEMSKHKVVIDGLYSWEEYQFLKSKFGKSLLVLAIFAAPESRYERLVDRDIRPLTKDQSRNRDVVEIENLNKAAPIAMADYTLLNTGTLFDLKESFDEFIEYLEEMSNQ